MAESKDYNSNFFFPTSAFAKDNNLLIGGIVIVWAIAVFGFHFWMKAIEKEVPEPGHTTYMAAVENLKSGSATVQEKQDVAKVYLMLLGKYLELRNNDVLKKAFTLAATELLPEDAKTALADGNKEVVAAALGLNAGKYDKLLINLIPYATTELDQTPTDYAKITPLMDKYLIHYRSFLTDTIFLGFPFHYFYSAVFLLVFFCGVCWFYCFVADRMMIKHNMESEEA